MVMSVEGEVRRAVLGGRRESISDLLLNRAQVRLLQTLLFRQVTSALLATELDVSIQNACAKLEKLRGAGYLRRYNVGDPTGGNMYEYECTPEVLNCNFVT